MIEPASKHIRARLSLATCACVAALIHAPLTANGQAAGPPSGPSASPQGARPLTESLNGPAAADYHAGRILFDDQDYAGAAIKFTRAYEASHDPRLLWNIAASEKNLRHYAVVSRLLERYLSEAYGSMSHEHRAEVDEVLRTVRMLISTLRITTDQPEVAIYVDDALAGTTPLMTPITVDLGRRSLRLTKPGFKDQRLTREIAGGSELSLQIVMEREETTGRLQVIAGDGQSIRIDGKIMGQAQWTGALPSGNHVLRVTADGMRAYEREVTIVAGEARTLYVTLEAEPSGIPTWAWIGASALVAGGLATGGYFLFRPPQEAAPEHASLGEFPL